MADDKSKTQPQDAQRVNVNEEYEVQYWSEKFGVSPERLKQAVQKVGTIAKNVEQELSSGAERTVGRQHA